MKFNILDFFRKKHKQTDNEMEEDTDFNFSWSSVHLASIPFQGSRSEIIYVEDKYEEATNNYIRNNITHIRKCFSAKGLRFVYLPQIGQELAEAKEVLRYLDPAEKCYRSTEIPSLKSDYLLNFTIMYGEMNLMRQPCLARYVSEQHNDEFSDFFTHFQIFPFDINEALKSEKYIDALCDYILNPYGIVQSFPYRLDYRYFIDNPDADACFDEETKKILKEVEFKIDLLRRKGISDVVLESLVKKKPELSRIVITKDMRIILPDYKDMEVTMEPLVKAVFLLFLKHPEGILFKSLPDYRQELSVLYDKVLKTDRIKHSPDTETKNKRITLATDPLNNSINEKCARIKETFLLKFREDLAENYFITGKRGEAKRIKIPNDMIIWEK